VNRLFIVSYVTLWVVTASLLVLVLLLYRQFGIMLMPGRRRIELGGLDLGERAPELVVDLPHEDRSSLLTWDTNGATLVVVAEPHCPICKNLLGEGGLESIPRQPGLDFVWLDEKRPEQDLPTPWTVAVTADGSAARLLDVPGYPFAYVLGRDGKVLAKGLVNTSGEVEQLIARVSLTSTRNESSTSPDSEVKRG
jgi:hypothetical protein